MITESFQTTPLAKVAPSYLYFQFSDDDDLQAFVSSYNQLTQGYIDWFNNTPLGFYVSGNISGLLLDWVAQGIYGIKRPIIITTPSTTSSKGGYDSNPYNTTPYNGFSFTSTASVSQIANDDIYKRVMTWILYRGDGQQMSIPWMKRRVARFLYGSNGSDVSVDYLQYVSINDIPGQKLGLSPTGGINGVFVNRMAVNGNINKIISIITPKEKMPSSLNTIPTDSSALNNNTPLDVNSGLIVVRNRVYISLPYSPMALTFQRLLSEGILPSPFQVNITVTLT